MNENLFVSTEVHERTVVLNKEEVKLYFKEVPAVEFRRYFLIEQSGDIEKQIESMPRLIASSICNVDGTSAMTYEKARTLKPQAMLELFKAVLSVNKQGDDDEGKPKEG
jgi:hypothetical protein